MTHHGCKLSVEGLCVVVRLVEVAISPLDEVPGLRRKAGRFGASCSSPDEDWLLRRRSTINTLHIVGSCRRGVGIEFDIRRLDTP